MSYYDVAVGGVRDNGTSYLQVGLNNKIQFSYLKKKKKRRDYILHSTSRILRLLSDFFHFPFEVKTLHSDRESI